jgi:hypothetical protein
MKTIAKYPPQKLREFMRFWSIHGGHIAFSFQFPQTDFKPTGLPLPQPQFKQTVWHQLTLQNFAHDPHLSFKEYEEQGIAENPPRGKDLHVRVTGQVAIRKHKAGALPMGTLCETTLEAMLEASKEGRRVRFEIDWDAQDTDGFLKTIWEV